MWRGCSCSCLSNYLSVYLSICLPIYLSIYVSIYLAVFLQVWKQSYSASLPQFSKLTTWKWSNSARHNKMWLRTTTSKRGPRMRCFVLYMLTWKCASCHNGVQLFIFHLPRWLRTRRFSEPNFRPSGATNQWKSTVMLDFSTFPHTCIFFLLTLSLL